MAINIASSAAAAFPSAASAVGRYAMDGSTPDFKAAIQAILAAISPLLPKAGQQALSVGGAVSPFVAPLAEGAYNAATTAAELGPAIASAAESGATAISPMAFWQLPQIVSSLYTLFNGGDEHSSGDTLRRLAGRERDSNAMSGQFFSAFNDPKRTFQQALDSPVENSNVGNTIGNILKYVNNGTWATDTSHGWLPDPSLFDFQKQLADHGYTGDEPRRGDVGGVGEMVMGSSPRFMNPALRGQTEEAFSTKYGHAYVPGADDPNEPRNAYISMTGESPDVVGPEAWSMFIRKIAGVPDSARNPWDFTRPIKYAADNSSSEGGSLPVPSPALDLKKFAGGSMNMNAPVDPNNQYTQYLDSLPWETNQKLRASWRNQSVYDGYNPGG